MTDFEDWPFNERADVGGTMGTVVGRGSVAVIEFGLSWGELPA
jgi:hypothetical protein